MPRFGVRAGEGERALPAVYCVCRSVGIRTRYIGSHALSDRLHSPYGFLQKDKIPNAQMKHEIQKSIIFMRYTSSCCYILITLRRQIGACIIAGGALACLLNATPANAQVDSLRQIIADPHSTLADKGMANLGLARAFAPVHTDTALYYAGEGLRYGQRSGDAKVEGSAYRYLGLIHASQQSYSEALSYYQKALETLPAVPDSGNIKAVYGSIGVLYMHLKDYTQALHYFEKGLILRTTRRYLSGIVMRTIPTFPFVFPVWGSTKRLLSWGARHWPRPGCWSLRMRRAPPCTRLPVILWIKARWTRQPITMKKHSSGTGHRAMCCGSRKGA